MEIYTLLCHAFRSEQVIKITNSEQRLYAAIAAL